MKIQKRLVGVVASSTLPSDARVRRVVRTVLASEKNNKKADILVIFVNTQTIRRLNKAFLGKNSSTDVIVFPYGRVAAAKLENPVEEIYICVPVARSNAKLYGQSGEEELTRLMVHGTLHLMGYDDTRPKKRKIMWNKQERLVQSLCSKKTCSS